MSKDQIKNVIIVALLLIVVGLGWNFVIHNTGEKVVEKMVYSGYHDDLLKIESQINANVVANLVEDNHYLAVYIESKEEKSVPLIISLNIIEDSGDLFYTGGGYNYQLTQGAKVGFVIPLPELGDEKLKEMKLDISVLPGDAKKQDLRQFTFDIKPDVDEYYNTTFNAVMNYTGKKTLYMVSGTMVAWKDNKILRLVGFEMEHVNPGETRGPFSLLLESALEKTSETVLEEKARQYDKIEAFVNYYEEEK